MAKRARNSIRVIGGRWRGRRLRFPAVEGVRPTPERLRETLFNWLGRDVEGARCLDLFAGSGALTFEAASRGAARATAIDASRAVTRALARNAQTLEAGDAIEVVQARVARYLQRSPAPADIVFVDAPFAYPEWADAALARLAEAGWLAPCALVYVEASAHGRAPIIPAAWQRVRRQRAGDAQALLLRADAIDARSC